MADLLDDADIDFERAASAFPDISLDGDGDIPTFVSPPPRSPPPPAGPFDLDAFGSPAPAREVRVTGHESDDDIGKFESDFPELDVPQVRKLRLCQHACMHAVAPHRPVSSLADDNPSQAVNAPPSSQPTFGAVPPFAPRPQPSALSATPILTQPIDAEEPEVIRYIFFLSFWPMH